jgi:sugar phosphate isomerase/epimerase
MTPSIGILTNTFTQQTLDGVLDAAAAQDITDFQFDLNCAGLESMPLSIGTADVTRIRAALDRRSMRIAALSGTFNMIHPNPAERADGLKRLDTLARNAAALGTRVITLCTGTRDTTSMWRFHADSLRDDAWTDLLDTMRKAVAIAEAHDVILAFEPEVNNCVDSARKARHLIDVIGSPRLKVVMDGANVFHTGELPYQREMLKQAFDLLGPHIALAHAKDLDHDGDAGHLPAGHGLLEYGLYLRLLRASGYSGPLVLHGLSEAQIPGCVAFLRGAGW